MTCGVPTELHPPVEQYTSLPLLMITLEQFWLHLMLEKTEVPTLLQNFCAMAVRQFGFSVKTLRTDNGTEFFKLKPYLRKEGILHQTSSVDTPQQNGRVERKHRHILNVARACLFQANLPAKFWGQSILTAAHLINRTPSRLLGGKSPYELLHGSPPNYDTLKVFGCLYFAQKRPKDHDKHGTSMISKTMSSLLAVTLFSLKISFRDSTNNNPLLHYQRPYKPTISSLMISPYLL